MARKRAADLSADLRHIQRWTAAQTNDPERSAHVREKHGQPSLARWVFSCLVLGAAFGQVAYILPTSNGNEKARYLIDSGLSCIYWGG